MMGEMEILSGVLAEDFNTPDAPFENYLEKVMLRHSACHPSHADSRKVPTYRSMIKFRRHLAKLLYWYVGTVGNNAERRVY